ncbi:ATP/GTP-binding protein [Streptomyces rochei]|uniref:ATP/GTP-binding protein n=1 Tax=Streptomyces rochei TaxID=1928 RepID=UPI00362AF753
MRLDGLDVASPRPGGKYTVGVPMWLWVNQGENTHGPATATTSAGEVTVTATDKVTSIRWTMGDGTTVTCAGPGTPYRGSQSMDDSPDCGHRYTRTSSGEPGERCPLSATSTCTTTRRCTGSGRSNLPPAERTRLFAWRCVTVRVPSPSSTEGVAVRAR